MQFVFIWSSAMGDYVKRTKEEQDAMTPEELKEYEAIQNEETRRLVAEKTRVRVENEEALALISEIRDLHLELLHIEADELRQRMSCASSDDPECIRLIASIRDGLEDYQNPEDALSEEQLEAVQELEGLLREACGG
jgi:hypothetical protein